MEVKINKEIRDYSENIYFGLSLRQFAFSILACVIAVLIYFCLKNYFPISELSWMCMLGASPFAILGFVKYNGMNAEEFVIAWIKSEILMPEHLCFVPRNYYNELTKEIIKKIRKERINTDK